jgi:type IV secretory pathway VirJ component
MKLRNVLRGLVIMGAVIALIAGSGLLARAVWATLTPPILSTETFQIDGFGSVDVVRSDRAPRGLVILADDASQGEERRQDAEALAKDGLIAVSFDFDAFRADLAKAPADDDCHYVSDDMKDLAQAVQRKLGLKRYFFPVVAGRGAGAAFAYAAVAQAPANTLGGAISIGFTPALSSDRPYCLEPKQEQAGRNLYTLTPQDELPSPWRVIGPESERNAIETFQSSSDQAEFVSAQGAAGIRQAMVESAARLGRSGERGHSELPVSVIEPEGPVTGLAVIISGDGGWRDIDKSIGEWLARKGVAVVGVDSLRYFWSKKSPGEVAADLGLLFDHYGKQFGTDRYAIVGFSFGSDIMPDVWPQLPKGVKDKVGLVSLLALGTNADFEITVEGFVGSASENSRPLVPLLNQLPLDRTQCIYGKEEAEDRESSCTAPELGSAQRVELEGGHHFDGDYAKAAEAIWERFQRRETKL